jgi:hypothetical protein
MTDSSKIEGRPDERVQVLDVHAVACLAGGTDRVVDTVLAVLVETGRVRVQRDGQLTMLDRRTRNEVEAAVLDAIGTRGHRTAGLVRQRAGADARLRLLVDRLVADGLLTARRRRWRGGGPGPTLTAAGRRALRQLRAEPPVRGVTAGTSAAAVAVHGPDRMPNPDLRAALFESDRPVRPRRRGLVPGRRAGIYGAAGSAALYSSGHQHGYGCGVHSCGGGGGGCGGGGGGGCGGGG